VKKVDIVIKNGKVVDGTGNPWFYNELGIEDGKIKEMARKLEVEADRTIDTEGLVVAPGFVDPHCHSEGAIVFHPEMEGPISQGVTTQTLGLCGTSPFPDKKTYIELCSHVYGANVLWYHKEFAKSTYDWNSLTEYSRLVMDRRPAINEVPLLGLGTILWKAGFKVAVPAEARKLTAEEMEKMKELTKQGMKEGAAGLSSSFDYIPDRYIDHDDLIPLLKIVADYSGGWFPHIRGLATPEGIREGIEIARKAGVSLHIAHINPIPSIYYGDVSPLPECLGIVDRARREGMDITFNVIQMGNYCYRHDSLKYSWRYFCRMYAAKPPEGIDSVDQFLKNLESPDYREEVKQLAIKHAGDAERYLGPLFQDHLGDVILIKTGDESLENKTLGQIGKEKGINPRDLFFDISFGVSPLVPKESNAFLIVPEDSEHAMVVEATNHPLAMPSSDFPIFSIPPDYYCSPAPYASFPYYYRNAIEHGVRMEEAVRKMTSFPAQCLGLTDRGILRKGMKADIVIFDPAEFRSAADYYNPTAKAPGVSYVIVNGKLVLDNGEQTKERPGQVLLTGAQ